ncbi:hypothetical protein EBQ93_05140, partial [bacterium]|nr:hypothetical protein [bacterium]
ELDNNYEEDEYDEEGQVVPVGLNDLYPASSSSSSSAARKKQDIMNMPCPEGLDSAFWNGINLTLDLYNSKPRTESFDRWSKKIIRERRSRYLRSPERRHHDRRLARERGRKYAQRQKEKSKIKKYDDEE